MSLPAPAAPPPGCPLPLPAAAAPPPLSDLYRSGMRGQMICKSAGWAGRIRKTGKNNSKNREERQQHTHLFYSSVSAKAKWGR